MAKTPACMLRARNECNQLIEAYNMPDWERAEFGVVRFVEEVVQESMRLSPAEITQSEVIDEKECAQLKRHTLLSRRDARVIETCEGSFEERVASQRSLGDHDSALQQATAVAEKLLGEKIWKKEGTLDDGSTELGAIPCEDGRVRFMPAHLLHDTDRPMLVLFLTAIFALFLGFAMVITPPMLVLNAPFLAIFIWAARYATQVDKREERLRWLVRANYVGLKAVNLLAD